MSLQDKEVSYFMGSLSDEKLAEMKALIEQLIARTEAPVFRGDPVKLPMRRFSAGASRWVPCGCEDPNYCGISQGSTSFFGQGFCKANPGRDDYPPAS